MIKIILLFFVFSFSFASVAHAADNALCPYGSLQLDFPEFSSAPNTKAQKIRLHGTLDTPNSGYIYDIKIEKMSEDNVAYGHFFLYEGDQDLDKTAVITPLKIDVTLEIPSRTRGIFLSAVKGFNWGYNLFAAKFDGFKSICLKNEAF